MKTLTSPSSRLLLATSLAWFASACGPATPQRLIVGTRDIESGMKATYEFRKDGMLSLAMMGVTAQGIYALNEQEELEIAGPASRKNAK